MALILGCSFAGLFVLLIVVCICCKICKSSRNSAAARNLGNAQQEEEALNTRGTVICSAEAAFLLPRAPPRPSLVAEGMPVQPNQATGLSYEVQDQQTASGAFISHNADDFEGDDSERQYGSLVMKRKMSLN